MRVDRVGLPEMPATAQTGEKLAPASSAPTPALQSAVLQPALSALRDMPDIDQAKVEALRDALARGDVPFDPARLAGLIKRYHGGRE